MSSRLKMTAKNAFWSYFSMGVSFVLQFVSRTVFIHFLGESYLGINGLFSNVLGVLSFAELGIGTAINFSLYKPVAEHDVEKIKAYMYYYKWAYCVIALVVCVLGVALIPFLDVLVTDPGNVGNIKVYYCIYLFNTVTSYFVSYKYSLVNAEQKNYVYTNVNLIVNVSTVVIQILSLVIWKNFLIYLLVAASFGVFQKIFISIYFNKLYPYLLDKKINKLSKEEKHTLFSKVKALILHKIGDVGVYQTDNIIVSAFVSTRMVGLLSNYNLIINIINGCFNTLFSSAVGSLGNLAATESKEYQYQIFKEYRFVGFWFYGFSAIALAILITPFITLWIGKDMTVDMLTINLIILDYYMGGQRICINNIKSAAGVFEPDKYVAILRAVVNLVMSILLVKLIGLPGVYIGTVIQGLLVNTLKPILSYKPLFGISSRYYFIDSARYGIVVLIAYGICYFLSQKILADVTIVRFAVMMVLVAVIPNVIFLLAFHRDAEFKYLVEIVKNLFNKIFRKLRK